MVPVHVTPTVFYAWSITLTDASVIGKPGVAMYPRPDISTVSVPSPQSLTCTVIVPSKTTRRLLCTVPMTRCSKVPSNSR